MNEELFAITHRVYGIELTFYDACVIVFDVIALVLALLCFLLSSCKKEDKLAGVYHAYPFSKVGDQAGFKAYRVASSKRLGKKKGAHEVLTTQESFECSTCGISLSLATQFYS